MFQISTLKNLRFVAAALAVSALFYTSCSKKVDTSATAQFVGEWHGNNTCGVGLGGWQQKANFFSNGRKGVFSFSINGTVYVGGGVGHLDFWSYTPSTNAWNYIGNIPGVLRYRAYATTFTVRGKGYVVGGTDSGALKNDIWAYDPSTNLWTQQTSSIPNAARMKLFSFTVNDRAYIGGGEDATGADLKDFFMYDPLGDSWTNKKDLPFTLKSAYAFAPQGVTTENKYTPMRGGYVSCGIQGGVTDTTTYFYDSSSDSWARKAGFPGDRRYGGACFTVGATPYCVMGSNGTNAFEDIWSFNASGNKWSKVGDFPGRFNAEPVVGVNGNSAYNATRAYVGLGIDTGRNYKYSWYEYTPPSASDTIKISGGSSNYTIQFTISVGDDSCKREVTLTGTVTSNATGKDYFSIGTHNAVDRCGKNYAVTGSGTLKEDVITITTVTSTAGGTSACTFTGSR